MLVTVTSLGLLLLQIGKQRPSVKKEILSHHMRAYTLLNKGSKRVLQPDEAQEPL